MLLKNCAKGVLEAGVDEAGRGPLAGAVFAAAVILPHDFYHPLLNDSKKMTRKNRELLAPIIEQSAIAFGVYEISPQRIDQINILNATFEAMNGAIEALATRPDCLLIDGNHFRTTTSIPYQCIIKGDAKHASIAAASVLAKTYRDAYMNRLHQEYPIYGWDKNAGYPTAAHRKAVEKFGPSPYHRLTFRGAISSNNNALPPKFNL